MTTQIQDQHISRFTALFERFEQQLNGQKLHPHHQIRQIAANQLEGLRFPTRRNEDYKYTSFTKLLKEDYQLAKGASVEAIQFQKLLLDRESPIQLVFVNGKFDPNHSKIEHLPKGLYIDVLSKSLEKTDTKTAVEEKLIAQAKSNNPFIAMNAAFADQGIHIRVDKNAIIEEPIQLLHFNTAEEQAYLYHPQRLIEVERGAQLKILDIHYGEKNAKYFSNVLNEFYVDENAHVSHYKFQTESTSAYQINNTTAYQKQDSTYTNLALDLGGRIVRNNLSAIHQGQNVTSNFYGVFHADGEQHIDHQTFIDHAIPHCQSNELYKGVMDDKGHGVFNGKVLVRKDAQKTNAYQQNAALVLSPKAVMDSKPQLEIFADDVKCSHGATIGQLDQTSMFYLRSRGMSTEKARETLQYAFLIEVLEQVNNEEIEEKAEALIYQKFAQKG